MFPRVPGYFIVDHEGPDPAGSYEFAVNKDEPKKVSGMFWHLSYKLKDGAAKATPAQIGRAYTDVVVKKGGRRIWERFEATLGGTAATLPPAEAGGTGTLWLQVDITGSGEYYDVYIVEEKGSAAASAFRERSAAASAFRERRFVASAFRRNKYN